jgi:hypothetical protein
MSKALGEAVLQPNYRGAGIPVMEHVGGLSRQALRHFTGIDPIAERHRLNEAFRRVAEAFEVDLLWGGGLPQSDWVAYDWDHQARLKRRPQAADLIQWGIFSATRQEDGRHFLHIPRPRTVEEALDFQPLEHFPKSVSEYRDEFQPAYDTMLESTGDTCLPLPHHYTTCFHWPLAIFGFELLCLTGKADEARFSSLMERFAEISTRITTAWAQVDGLKGFILHDDLTMSGGPIFAPAWYRRHVFPHYPAIFKPLIEKGVPIIFTSDGDCTEFVDDIFAAGAEGLNFEYLVELQPLVERYRDKVLIGNINSGTLARGPLGAIEREVRRCLEVGSRARRFVVNVGGGLTHDIPVAHLEYYLELRKNLARNLRANGSAVPEP